MDPLRRNDVSRMTATEKAIHHAMIDVENLGAHPLLTDAVALLDQARHKVADYVDSERKGGEGHATPPVMGGKE